MAAQPPPSSTSSRRRAGDKVVGSFSIEDEIGKGSFATVFRGTHKVCHYIYNLQASERSGRLVITMTQC